MDVQISHSIHAEISKEDHLQQIQREYRTDLERSMQVERSGDNRGESDDRSYSLAGVDSTQVQCLEFHGTPEREECANDF